MFVSFKLLTYGDKLSRWEIMDDKIGKMETQADSIWDAIIQEYEKRNLPVMKNLVLCYLLLNRYYKKAELNMYPIPEPYKKEMEKYIILL